jgi:hypothetical protein
MLNILEPLKPELHQNTIVTQWMNAWILEPEETASAWQRHGKHMAAATDTQATELFIILYCSILLRFTLC